MLRPHTDSDPVTVAQSSELVRRLLAPYSRASERLLSLKTDFEIRDDADLQMLQTAIERVLLEFDRAVAAADDERTSSQSLKEKEEEHAFARAEIDLAESRQVNLNKAREVLRSP
jgi:hypothetical protein